MTSLSAFYLSSPMQFGSRKSSTSWRSTHHPLQVTPTASHPNFTYTTPRGCRVERFHPDFFFFFIFSLHLCLLALSRIHAVSGWSRVLARARAHFALPATRRRVETRRRPPRPRSIAKYSTIYYIPIVY